MNDRPDIDVVYDDRGSVGGGTVQRLHSRLHRSGWARAISGTGNNWNRNATMVIDTRGPQWLGQRLWRFALRHSTSLQPDWFTVRVDHVERPGRWRYRWHVSYQRVRR